MLATSSWFLATATKAMCALDQQPHARMSLQWSVVQAPVCFAARGARRHSSLESIEAHCDRSSFSKHSAAGWAHVGLVPGEPINPQQSSAWSIWWMLSIQKVWAKLEEKPESKGSAVLDLVSKVAPKKEECSNPDCRKAFAVTYKHCPSCGAENSHFDAQELMLSGPGKKSGWVKR